MSEKVNLQNLPKSGVLGGIRQLLIAPPGYKLVVVDAASIEARITPWVSDQLDLLEKFRNKEDAYIALGSKIVGYPLRPATKTGIPAIEARHKAGRALGKVGVLGCGFGMGKDRCLEYANSAPYFCNIDADTAARIVDTFRTENKEIVAGWRRLEKAFLHSAKHHTATALNHGVRFDAYPDCDVVMTLPNGREIHYLKVKLGRGNFGGESARVFNAREMSWEHIWGGVLMENLVQAIARDCLTECTLRLEDRGVSVALTSHDEVVCVVEESKAEQSLAAALEEMARTPDWAPGLPLGAEGSVMEAYSK